MNQLMTGFLNSFLEFFGFLACGGIFSLPIILIVINNDKSVLEKAKKYAENNGFLYVDEIDFVNLKFTNKNLLDNTDFVEINEMEKEMYEQDEEIINTLDKEKLEIFEKTEAKRLIPARFSKHYENFDILNKGEINEYTSGLFKLLDNIEISIFNYNCRTLISNKKAGSAGDVIVCVLYNKDLIIPEFYLRSRNPVDGFLNTAGSLFEEDKAFSNTFIKSMSLLLS